MKTINLGILAHVDAGKTSLTERLLYSAGAIKNIGSVDKGSTQTDSLALEKQRGITIRSAVASFEINGTRINLIDTPGHSDFIAEVERVLSILDGVVLVISAVEGIQAQTRVLMRALQRLHIPIIIFVNKIDRSGAQYESILSQITDHLAPSAMAMGTAHNLGTKNATFIPYDECNISSSQVKNLSAYPVFFGSAITGAGIDALIDGITKLLPATSTHTSDLASATVFKIERGKKGEKITYIRMFAGSIRIREKLRFSGGKEGKVTSISVFENGISVRRHAIVAGEIGKLLGLDDIKIGDSIGKAQKQVVSSFGQPTLETVVTPHDSTGKSRLFAALSLLAEQDPLICLRQNDDNHELRLSLYGEVQKEVIYATLAQDFGIDAEFSTTTPKYIERPASVGVALVTAEDPSNPIEATVGIRIEPATPGSGVGFSIEVDTATWPPASFRTAVEESVRETLRSGLHGRQVTDCTVVMTHSIRLRKHATSTAADFRKLTPSVIRAALQNAGVIVCEPILRFRLDIPEESIASIIATLAQLHAAVHATHKQDSGRTVTGTIPAIQVDSLQLQLPALTNGQGILEYVFDRYEPVKSHKPYPGDIYSESTGKAVG
jgi:ribosomal protection tetracycline resistance protein